MGSINKTTATDNITIMRGEQEMLSFLRDLRDALEKAEGLIDLAGLFVPFILATSRETFCGGYLSDDERIAYGPSQKRVRVETHMMFPLDGSDPFEGKGEGVSEETVLEWGKEVKNIALLAKEGIRTACLRGESEHEIFGTGFGWSARYPEGNWWNFPPEWEPCVDLNLVQTCIRFIKAKAWEKEARTWLKANPAPKNPKEFGLRGKVPSWLREEKSKRRCPEMRWVFEHQAKWRAQDWFPNSGPGCWVWAITLDGEDHLVRHEEEEGGVTFFQFWGLDPRTLVVAWEVREVMVDGYLSAERFGIDSPQGPAVKHRYKVLQAPQGGLSKAQKEWARKLRDNCPLYPIPGILENLAD